MKRRNYSHIGLWWSHGAIVRQSASLYTHDAMMVCYPGFVQRHQTRSLGYITRSVLTMCGAWTECKRVLANYLVVYLGLKLL